MKQTEREFCGCCGGRLEYQTDIWCKACSKHVSKDLEFWEATWYAQHGNRCPFEVEGQSAWSRQMKIDDLAEREK